MQGLEAAMKKGGEFVNAKCSFAEGVKTVREAKK